MLLIGNDTVDELLSEKYDIKTRELSNNLIPEDLMKKKAAN